MTLLAAGNAFGSIAMQLPTNSRRRDNSGANGAGGSDAVRVTTATPARPFEQV
ncbi:hypothetical protein [Amycolatopsis sp. lyj-109]|uniref:hypothetical protein n=1 Tax=Amycolatopsis sp. lyj-109 TaxID=2789287 RepID=UPI00397D6473